MPSMTATSWTTRASPFSLTLLADASRWRGRSGIWFWVPTILSKRVRCSWALKEITIYFCSKWMKITHTPRPSRRYGTGRSVILLSANASMPSTSCAQPSLITCQPCQTTTLRQHPSSCIRHASPLPKLRTSSGSTRIRQAWSRVLLRLRGKVGTLSANNIAQVVPPKRIWRATGDLALILNKEETEANTWMAAEWVSRRGLIRLSRLTGIRWSVGDVYLSRGRG